MAGLLGLLLGGDLQNYGGANGFVSPDDLDRRKQVAQGLLGQSGLLPVLLGAGMKRGVDRDTTRMQSGASDLWSRAFGLPANAASRETASAPASVPANVKDGIVQTANALGINPVDLATAISYETAGTFDPVKAGPTTKWGQHKGLIQFGQPQAQQYGVDWNNPVGSQLGANGAVAKYLTDAGVKPGMGLMDIYSAINAGKVGRYGASDASAGGAPGTVADKVNNQMAAHRAKAMALLAQNGAPTVQPAADAPVTAQPPMGMSFNGPASVAPPVQRPVPQPQPQVIPAAALPMQQPVQQRPMTAFERLNATAAGKYGSNTVGQPRAVTQNGGWNPFAPRMAQPPVQQPMPAGGPSLPQQTGLAQDGGTAPAGNDRLTRLEQAIGSPSFQYLAPMQQKMLYDEYQAEYARANPDPKDALDADYKKAQIAKLQADIEASKNPDARKKFGLQPQYGVDANGNPVLLQLGDNGEAVTTQMPDGVKLSKEPIKLDAGTSYILLDPITRQVIGTVPKDIQGEAAQKAAGTAQGGAQAELAPSLVDAQNTIDQINDLLADPNLSGATGAVEGRLPDSVLSFTNPGAFSSRQKIEQLKGKAFLNAYATLKGGGSITEIEGAKASAALARMNTAQSDDEFRAALSDFKDAIQTGLNKLAARAGTPAPQVNKGGTLQPAQTAAPAMTYPQAQIDLAKSTRGLSSDQEAVDFMTKNGVKPLPALKSKADYDALPAGAQYLAPDGTVRTKR